MRRYDEGLLLSRLTSLSPSARTAFALLCAERLSLAFVAFARRTERLSGAEFLRILDWAWEIPRTLQVDSGELAENIQTCMKLIPDEDEGRWADGQAYAEDAAAALAYALRSVEGEDPREALWAARRAFEAQDYFASHESGLVESKDPSEHYAVQAELNRQDADIAEIEKADNGNAVSDAALQVLRLRAKSDAARLVKELIA